MEAAMEDQEVVPVDIHRVADHRVVKCHQQFHNNTRRTVVTNTKMSVASIVAFGFFS